MKYYLVIFMLITSFCNAQTIINSPSNLAFKPAPFEISNYGDSYLNIYYAVSFYENSLSENGKKEAVCLLQLGDKASKFFDYNRLKIDSLDQKYKDYGILKTKEANDYLKINVIWKNVMLKNNNHSIIQDNFRKTYQYDETTPNLIWNVEEGEKIVLGYNCRRATTNYRGRKYTAWYTTEIPINKGPLFFEGLPGLIMEVNDSDNKYNFIAIGIDKKPMKIYLRNEKNRL